MVLHMNKHNSIKSGKIFSTLFLPFFIFICFQGCDRGETNPQKILIQSADQISKIEAAQYGYQAKQKFFKMSDTASSNGTFFYYYENGNINLYEEYAAKPLLFLLRGLNYTVYPSYKAYDTDSTSNPFDERVEFFMKKGNNLREVAQDTSFHLTYKGIKKVNGVKCDLVEALQKEYENPDITYWKYSFYIDRKTQLPKRISKESDLMGKIGFRDYVFHYFQPRQDVDQIKDLITSKINFVKANYKDNTQDYKDEENLSESITQFDFSDGGLTTLEGKNVAEIKADNAKLMLVDFWYTNCYPCLLALPDLEKLHRKYKEKGLQVVGIDVVDTNTAIINDVLKRKKVTYEILMNGGKFSDKYKLTAFPSIVLLDKNYQVVYRETGFAGINSKLDSAIASRLK